ncbi:MAG: thioredoxin-disulfide reductase [Candidatus Walczuchella monophlebidarum]
MDLKSILMLKESVQNCVIIGSGPAGYSAAIYTARAGLNPLVYAGKNPGGQLTTTTLVENYPGYPNGITGPELMEKMKKQAESFGAIVKRQTIVKVSLAKEKNGINKLYTDNNEKVLAKAIIIATGALSKDLGLESEERFKGYGVSSCAICDGFLYKDKVVAVVGGGDTALEETISLSQRCKIVYLLVRSGELRASKAMQCRLWKISNLKIYFYHEIKEILGDRFVEGVRIINNKNKKESILSIEGIFIAIGHIPNTAIFRGQINLDQMGYIITKKGSTHTNIPSVFAAGDVQDAVYRQAITSSGTGCMAALDLERYLMENH